MTGARGSAGGFTLIEVLLALTILAVGVLAVQAMTLAAVRSASLAERNTRSVASATAFLEETVEILRRGHLPAPLQCALANGDTVTRELEPTGRPEVVRVLVRVAPAASPSAPPPLTLASYGYSASGFVSSDSSFACP